MRAHDDDYYKWGISSFYDQLSTFHMRGTFFFDKFSIYLFIYFSPVIDSLSSEGAIYLFGNCFESVN